MATPFLSTPNAPLNLRKNTSTRTPTILIGAGNANMQKTHTHITRTNQGRGLHVHEFSHRQSYALGAKRKGIAMKSKEIYLSTAEQITESLVMMRDHAYELSGMMKASSWLAVSAEHTTDELEEIGINSELVTESLSLLQSQIASTLHLVSICTDNIANI